MAQMTENINLQRALLRRIESADKRIVEIREGSKVGEMQLGDGQQWVGLRIGEDKWVRGSVVVGRFFLWLASLMLCRSEQTAPIHRSDGSRISRSMVMPTSPTRSSRLFTTIIHPYTPTTQRSSGSSPPDL